jgi:hypothetical protein
MNTIIRNKVYTPESLEDDVVRIMTTSRYPEGFVGVVSRVTNTQIGVVPINGSNIFWFTWDEIESIEVRRIAVTYEPITVALGGVAQ